MRLLTLLLALFPLLATAQTVESFKVTVPGYGSCNVEMYKPAGWTKGPALLFVPGNGETGGNKEQLYKYGPLQAIRAGYKPTFAVVAFQPIYGFAGPVVLTALFNAPQVAGVTQWSATGLSGGAQTINKYIRDINLIKFYGIAPMSIAVDNPKIANYAGVKSWWIVGNVDAHRSSMLNTYNAIVKAGYPTKWTEIPGDHEAKVWLQAYAPAFGLYDYIMPAGSTPPPVVASSKRVLFDLKGSGRTVYNTTLRPGDTAVLTSSGTYFTLVGVKGVTVIADKAITLLNGFSVENGEDIEINGQYLVTIRGVGKDTAGPAISVTGTAKNITVREVIAKRKFTGVWWKNEASCDVSKNFPANVMDGCYIYDNRIDSMTNQGMYIGSTDANNHSRPITCNGTVYNYLPSRIRNIEVVGNFVSNTGRPGIQVSGAYEGKNIISENTVYNTGIGGDDAQGTGISIGAYTRAIIEKNDVRRSGTWLIASLGGAGEVIIRDNYLDSAGWNSKGGVAWASAIGINTVRTVPVDSTYLTITGNKIGSYRHPQAITIGNDAKTLARQVTISGNLHKGQAASVLDNSGFVPVVPPVTPPPAKTILRVITVYTDGTVEYK